MNVRHAASSAPRSGLAPRFGHVRLDPKVKAAITTIDHAWEGEGRVHRRHFDEATAGWISWAEVFEIPFTIHRAVHRDRPREQHGCSGLEERATISATTGRRLVA
jgi:hypothetical protein